MKRGTISNYNIASILIIICIHLFLPEIFIYVGLEVNNLFYLAIIQVFIIGIPYLILSSKIEKGAKKNIHFKEGKQYKSIIYSVLIGISLSLIILLIDDLISLFNLIMINIIIDNFNKLSIVEFLISILSLALLPSVFEEKFYRELGSIYYSKKSLIIRCLTISILFSLIHGSIIMIIYGFFFSILMLLIYHNTENIYYCIISHFTLNASVLFFNSIIRLPSNIFYIMERSMTKDDLIIASIIISIVLLLLINILIIITYNFIARFKHGKTINKIH